MANTINFALAQMTAQPSNAEALYNFMQALFDSMALHVVVSSTTSAEPGSPTEEQAYIIPVGATGTNWGGGSHDRQVTVRINGTWYFFAPKDGWTFWDQANQYSVRYDLATTTWVIVAQTKTLTILNPVAADLVAMAYFKRPVTIRRVNGVVQGTVGPSVTFNLKHGTDRSAAGTNLFSSDQVVNSTTTGNEFTTFADATLAAGEWLWYDASAVAGTTRTELSITVEYTEDS